jgi:hypothetical protein
MTNELNWELQKMNNAMTHKRIFKNPLLVILTAIAGAEVGLWLLMALPK